MISRLTPTPTPPFRTLSLTLKVAGASLALLGGGLGCLSMQSQTSLDGANTNATNNTSTQPYVEMYVEYPGPQQKWAGPASFIVHVAARDSGAAQITTTPALLTDDTHSGPSENSAPTVTQRNPASSSLAQTIVTPPRHPADGVMSGEVAREQLAHLATALQGAQAPFHGCMSPVRVRLVRADGGLFERQGCRGEQGWSRAVSDAVNVFIESAWSNAHNSANKAGGKTSAQQTTDWQKRADTSRLLIATLLNLR